jgi:hypothetical protein
MVCIKYCPVLAPGAFAPPLRSEKVYASVKKPDPVNVNHCSMVTLPLDGKMVAGRDKYPPAKLEGLKLGLLNWSWPPETVAIF